jgi:hypothetical protein
MGCVIVGVMVCGMDFVWEFVRAYKVVVVQVLGTVFLRLKAGKVD